jgi:hypothetical protein
MNPPVAPNGKPKVRIDSIYSTRYVYDGAEERRLDEELLLGSLSNYYDLFRNQLPRLLPDSFLHGPDNAINVGLADSVAGVQNQSTDAMLFALPSSQVILVIRFVFDCDLNNLDPIVRVLEQSIEGRVALNGQPLESALREKLAGIEKMKLEQRMPDATADAAAEAALLPERHQLVFIRRSNEQEEVPTAEAVRTIVYRATPPLTEEFARPKTPEQLNQVRVVERPGRRGDTVDWRQLLRLDEPQRAVADPETRKITLGVVTPYVSLLFGHQEYIEESVLLSSVHAVGTASKFRQIWYETYRQVQLFRKNKQEQVSGRQTRDSLESLADELGNLEFDLTFSVEFPQLRIESFQAALYDAMDLSTQAKTLSDMFTQVSSSVRSEITAITVREQRRDEARHKWNAFAAGLLSLAGVSVGFVIGFLGINTTEVPTNKVSMWSDQFVGVYIAAALFAFSTTFLIAFPYIRDRLQPRKRSHRRAMWVGLPLVVVGAAIGVVALVNALMVARQAPPIDAFGEGGGAFLTVVGLSIVGMWTWYQAKIRSKAAADRRS